MMLQHHIEEENKLFKKAKAHITGSEANKMQEEMDAEKKRLIKNI